MAAKVATSIDVNIIVADIGSAMLYLLNAPPTNPTNPNAK
jgi:hypothetical protein